MKRSLSYLGAILLLASCESSGPACVVPQTTDFRASACEESRTELREDNDVLWVADDLFTVFSVSSHNRKYRVSELSEDRRTALFTWTGDYTGDDMNAPATNFALYPYHPDARLSGQVITTVMPGEQTYDSERVSLAYALMVARTATPEDDFFAFKNAGGLLRINVSKASGVPESQTLQSIRLTSKSRLLSGRVEIDLAGDNKAVVVEGDKELSLVGINREITTESSSFYIALPETSFEAEDLSLEFTFTEGSREVKLPAFELLQNSIMTYTLVITADDFTGHTPGYEEATEQKTAA